MMRLAPLLLLLSLLVVSCKKGAAPANAKGGRGGKGTVFPVDVMVVEVKKNDYLVRAPGSVEAFERVQVTARVAGVVDKVAFREGQEVKKGDVLVVIDGERFRLSVNTAKAGLEKTQAAQADVEAQVRRREGASDKNPGLIPGEELETYRTKGLTAKADTAVAKENLRAAQLNLRDSGVRAPMSGLIQTRTVETGQYVNAGYVMATLLQVDPMLLKFQVLPQDAPRLKQGMTARFKLRESTREFTATLALVGGSADVETRMVPVTAQVDPAEHKFWLRPGSFADVTITLPAARAAPLIPRAAVRPSDRGFIAYVLDGEVVREKVLTLGMNTSDGWVEVRDGLEGGEKLVVRGTEPLSDGAKVKPREITSLDQPPPDAPEPARSRAPDSSPAPSSSGERRRRGGQPQP